MIPRFCGTSQDPKNSLDVLPFPSCSTPRSRFGNGLLTPASNPWLKSREIHSWHRLSSILAGFVAGISPGMGSQAHQPFSDPRNSSSRIPSSEFCRCSATASEESSDLRVSTLLGKEHRDNVELSLGLSQIPPSGTH